MQEPVACQLFIFCKDDVARCVPAGDNDARPDHLVNKCNLPPCLRGWVRSISTTKLVVNEQLKPVEIIDWSMIPCTRGQGTCTYGGVGCGHTPSIVPIRTPIIGARQRRRQAIVLDTIISGCAMLLAVWRHVTAHQQIST